ncbi:MAG: plastocyanin/azurin family copper-binding protein [Halobacteriales archaeon]|nr:plastocyanin/azurin family copper-binding protein [Halobacteriales archaeon]
MNRREFLATTALITGIAGCTTGGSTGSAAVGTSESQTTKNSDASGDTAKVWMHQTSFAPRRLSVDPGTTVEWVNADLYSHNVHASQFHEKAEDWEFKQNSGIYKNEILAYTFDDPGIYEYHCHHHGKTKMCGVILVGDVTLEKPLPCKAYQESQ